MELDEEDPEPDSGRTLTPGRPVDFRLGPVDSPTALLQGAARSGWRFPRNASLVTFTLESVDPDVDVDLYVRYGEDNDVQNGRPVY